MNYINLESSYKDFSCLRGNIIILEGLIGVGKSTLGACLYQFLLNCGIESKWFNEPINDKLLKLYISDMNKYAFSFQTIVARERLNIYKEAVKWSKKGFVVFIDRSLIGDMSFAIMQRNKGYISTKEFEVYLNLISDQVQEPHCTLFLDCSPKVAWERMKERGQKEEVSGYSLAYFEDLNRAYSEAFNRSEIKRLSINWEEKQPIVNGQLTVKTCKNILYQLRKYLLGV